MKTSSAIMLSFRLSVYTFSSKFVNADGRIRTSGPVTAGLLLRDVYKRQRIFMLSRQMDMAGVTQYVDNAL